MNKNESIIVDKNPLMRGKSPRTLRAHWLFTSNVSGSCCCMLMNEMQGNNSALGLYTLGNPRWSNLSRTIINSSDAMNEIYQYPAITTNLFADDLKIYTDISFHSDTTSFQRHLNLIHSWSLTWQLNIAFSKCNTMQLGAHFVPHHLSSTPYRWPTPSSHNLTNWTRNKIR